MPPEPGLAGHAELIVCEEDTATAHRSGDVPVLATPRIVALCEEATMSALDGHMSATETAVGQEIQIDHLAPTAVGSTVHADATIEEVHGRRITFKVSARDERGLIAAGKVTRVVVEREAFLDKTN